MTSSKWRFRPAQLEIFKYTLKVRHPALFVEMRIGKCLPTIRRCMLYKPVAGPVVGLKILIVCPSSAIGSWVEALEAEGVPFILCTGNQESKAAAFNTTGSIFYVTNKESFLWAPREIAHSWNWDAVVLDESTCIKNPKSKITQFFLKMYKDCHHRWILTGSPNAESDLDFICQMIFLTGSFLGCRDYWQVRAKYYEPTGYDWTPKSGTTSLIQKEIAAKAIVMTRADAGYTTNEQKIVRQLELPIDLQKKYDSIERNFEYEETQTIWAMVKYNWLRKLTGGFSPENTPVWDGKLLELVYLLKTELKEVPVVVWFHYNHEIQAVYERLQKENIISNWMDGSLSSSKREDRRQAFMQGHFNVLLMQQAIGQMGMNLSRADTVIYYSETPSSIASRQTKERNVDLSKSTQLLYIYLVVKKTVDSDLHELLQMKRFNSSLTLSKALHERMLKRAG